MTGWLIYDRTQFEKNRWFANELIKRCSSFCKMKLIITERLRFGVDGGKCFFEYDGELTSAPDFAVNRCIFPLLTLTLEKSDTRVFNSYETAKVCNDKRLTHLAVSVSGVPMMKTSFFEKRFFEAERVESTCFPCVMKSAGGHGGKEVFLLQNQAELEKSLSLLETDCFLIQERCRSSRDLRVYVLGGKIIGSVLRTPERDAFKSNFSLGGKVEAFEADSALISAVNNILSSLPCTPDFVGIDFLFDEKGLVFNEIEDVVGTRMLYRTTDVDAAELFSQYIKKRMSHQTQTKEQNQNARDCISY